MSNNEKNFKKLSKDDISNISGGWYVKEVEVGETTPEDPSGSVMLLELEVYDNNDNLLGTAYNFTDAKKIADNNNGGAFDYAKSSPGTIDIPEQYKKSNRNGFCRI